MAKRAKGGREQMRGKQETAGLSKAFTHLNAVMATTQEGKDVRIEQKHVPVLKLFAEEHLNPSKAGKITSAVIAWRTAEAARREFADGKRV
ncbi:MAG: hypothetical protein V1834_04225 [Candidatus Micrarchaeota archaeon]